MEMIALAIAVPFAALLLAFAGTWWVTNHEFKRRSSSKRNLARLDVVGVRQVVKTANGTSALPPMLIPVHDLQQAQFLRLTSVAVPTEHYFPELRLVKSRFGETEAEKERLRQRVMDEVVSKAIPREVWEVRWKSCHFSVNNDAYIIKDELVELPSQNIALRFAENLRDNVKYLPEAERAHYLANIHASLKENG